MTTPEEKSNSGKNRRQVLQTLGTAGVSLTGLPVVAGKTNDGVELVLTRDREGPVKTRVVPKAWYEQVNQAKKVKATLEKEFLNKDGVLSVGLGTTESHIGGLKEKSVTVSLKTGLEQSTLVPNQVNGVNIQTKGVNTTEYLCYEGSYPSLRGGISVENSLGSVCGRVYKNGSPYLLTARHLFTDTGYPCGSIPDKSVSRNGDQIGTVAGSAVEHDIAWIDIDSSHVLSDKIASESARISGWVTEAGLDTFSSEGTTLHKRGIAGCEDTYTIDSYNNTTYAPGCDTPQKNVVHYDGGTASPGDSGGIIYDISPAGDAYVCGVLSGRDTVTCGLFCNDDIVFGSAAHAMLESPANLQSFE